MNTRMDRKRLNIGTYHLKPYARTEQHVKDLADCGIDFVICMDYDESFRAGGEATATTPALSSQKRLSHAILTPRRSLKTIRQSGAST